MGMKEIMEKMFMGARQTHDEFGQPIQEISMEEKLLQKHMERERKKKIRQALKYYEKKNWKEMTSMELPYHKKARIMAMKKKRRKRRK